MHTKTEYRGEKYRDHGIHALAILVIGFLILCALLVRGIIESVYNIGKHIFFGFCFVGMYIYKLPDIIVYSSFKNIRRKKDDKENSVCRN
jgi:hypothetical protein